METLFKKLSVKQAVEILTNIIYLSPQLQDLWIFGEIRDLSISKQGHVYFSLAQEDEKRYQINCVAFKDKVKDISQKLENGQMIEVFGGFNYYSAFGKLSFYVEKINFREEIGGITEKFRQIYNKLLKEGLFDEIHKKEIPPFPKKIGIITSVTGAAIKDVLKLLKDKLPMQIYIYNCLVQGQEAVPNILRALNYLENMDLDLILLTRGGGAYDELAIFNDEFIARKIFEMNTPVISAIGHERDMVITDYVADLRAPTPTAAGKIIGIEKQDFLKRLEDSKFKIVSKLNWLLSIHNTKLSHLNIFKRIVQMKLSEEIQKLENNYNKFQASLKLILEKLKKVEKLKFPVEILKTKLNKEKLKLENLKQKLLFSINSKIEKEKNKLELLKSKLDTSHVVKIIENGYAQIKKGMFKVNSIKNLKVKDKIEIKFIDGVAIATINKIIKK